MRDFLLCERIKKIIKRGKKEKRTVHSRQKAPGWLTGDAGIQRHSGSKPPREKGVFSFLLSTGLKVN